MYNSNGVNVGSTLERRIKAGNKVLTGDAASAYIADRSRYNSAVQKAEIEFAPKTKISFRSVKDKKTGEYKTKAIRGKTIL